LSPTVSFFALSASSWPAVPVHGLIVGSLVGSTGAGTSGEPVGGAFGIAAVSPPVPDVPDAGAGSLDPELHAATEATTATTNGSIEFIARIDPQCATDRS
jgi:hypothetical protein